MLATVIKAPAGLGKTRAFARRVATSTVVAEIYVPTHRLAVEWRHSILRINPSKRIQIIRGRDAEVQPGVHLCVRHVQAAELSKASVAVYQNLCSRSHGAGAPPTKCQHHGHCQYIAQFQHADVYIYTHAHLALERGVLENWLPAEVIIDESFFLSLIQTVMVPIALLTHSAMPAPARSLCADTATALVAGISLQPRFALAAMPGGGLKATLNALDNKPPLSPSDTDSQQRATLSQTINFGPVRALLSHLAQALLVQPNPQSVVYDPATGQIVVHRRQTITRFNRPDGTQPDIFVLDASASPQIVSQFFAINFVPYDVGRKAYVIQCHSTRCSTTHIVPSKNKNPTSAAAAARRLSDITGLIARMATVYPRVLVVGPAAVVGNRRSGALPLIAVPGNCELAHFNSLRGVDRYKDCDAAVIVGRNEPPVSAIEDAARALYYDDPNPLQLPGSWSCQVRGYRLRGGSLGVDTTVHTDPRVQAVTEQLREAESLQAIDRLRLIHAAQDKLVIVLSNLPLDIDVDETRSWDDLLHGTRLERAFDQIGGVLPLNPRWLAENFPDSWPTAAAAKKDVSRQSKRGHLSNLITIRKVSPSGLQYKANGARKWSKCLSTSNDARHVEKVLESLLGQKVAVRLAKARP